MAEMEQETVSSVKDTLGQCKAIVLEYQEVSPTLTNKQVKARSTNLPMETRN